MEARGIPAVVLGTDAFLSLGRAQAAKLGLPHLAVALVEHPIGGIDPAIVGGSSTRCSPRSPVIPRHRHG